MDHRDGGRRWTQEPCSSMVCDRVCVHVCVSKGRPCDCAHIVCCARSRPCAHTCVISTHSTEVGETLAVGTLPLLSRGSCGGEGFLDQEGFRREDLGLMEALVSFSVVASARLFGSSESRLPCLSGRGIHICPGVGVRVCAGQV